MLPAIASFSSDVRPGLQFRRFADQAMGDEEKAKELVAEQTRRTPPLWSDATEWRMTSPMKYDVLT